MAHREVRLMRRAKGEERQVEDEATDTSAAAVAIDTK